MSDIETVTALGYDPISPWAPVRCADCKTIIRQPGDAACESCEVIAETMRDLRDAYGPELQLDGEGAQAGDVVHFRPRADLWPDPARSRPCSGCDGAGVLVELGTEVVCLGCGGLGVVEGAPPPDPLVDNGPCRVCGCTDLDCRGCYERTGTPCHWVEADLCSACEGARLVVAS